MYIYFLILRKQKTLRWVAAVFLWLNEIQVLITVCWKFIFCLLLFDLTKSWKKFFHLVLCNYSLLMCLSVIIIKLRQWSANLSPGHFYFSFGIICGPFWGSLAVSGSFAVRDHLRYCTNLLDCRHRPEIKDLSWHFKRSSIGFHWKENNGLSFFVFLQGSCYIFLRKKVTLKYCYIQVDRELYVLDSKEK